MALAAMSVLGSLSAGVVLSKGELANVTLKVDFDTVVGPVRPEHGVGAYMAANKKGK